MTNALTLHDGGGYALMPADANRDTRNKIDSYLRHLSAHGGHWLMPDLDGYATFLRHTGLKEASVSAYVYAVAGQYKRLLRTNEFYDTVREQLRAAYPDTNQADLEILTQAALERMGRALSWNKKAIKHQDKLDTGTRLTSEQVATLLALPDISTNKGLRDRAIMALCAGLGLRSEEVCSLVVADIDVTHRGAVVCVVRNGKGGKQRVIPYGAAINALEYTREWLSAIGRTNPNAPVFSKVDRWDKAGEKSLSPQSLTDYIIPSYSAALGIAFNAHDFRRTYARLSYEAGMELYAIQQNLGHADPKITQSYIGASDMTERLGVVEI